MDRWERFKKAYLQASKASTLGFFLMLAFLIIVAMVEAIYPPLAKPIWCVGFLFFFTFITAMQMDFFNSIFGR